MLEINTVYKRGILFIKLYGVINKSNLNEINDVLESVIKKVGIKYLVLNFENVYYVNADISSVVIRWSNTLKRKEGRLFICGYEYINKNYLNVSDSVYDLKDEFSVFNIIKI